MEEAQSSYCCVASAYVVVLPCAAAAAVVVSSSDRCAFIDDVFPRLVRHLYYIRMCVCYHTYRLYVDYMFYNICVYMYIYMVLITIKSYAVIKHIKCIHIRYKNIVRVHVLVCFGSSVAVRLYWTDIYRCTRACWKSVLLCYCARASFHDFRLYMLCFSPSG